MRCAVGLPTSSNLNNREASKLNIAIAKGVEYLRRQSRHGLYREFGQLRHGPGLAWPTACVGSALAEFDAVPGETLAALMNLQWESGGWSYNQNVLPDADTTLRVMQFFGRINQLYPKHLWAAAYRFVEEHQQADGGIATYLPKSLVDMGYPGNSAWAIAHPCVTALAAQVLRNSRVGERAATYSERQISRQDFRSYWWSTPWYMLYLTGHAKTGPMPGEDSAEIALYLLWCSSRQMPEQQTTSRLIKMQQKDGSFPSSRLFRIPRPHQTLNDLTGNEETIEDRARLFSTSAAIVALRRQQAFR